MSKDAQKPTGLSRALYDEIRARIADGTYAAGAALPSTRALALERGLSRATVSVVYDQLAADGFIETRPGAASRVAAGGAPPNKEPDARKRGVTSSKPKSAGRLSLVGDRVAAMDLKGAAQPAPGDIDLVYGPLAGSDFPTLTWMKAQRRVERQRSTRLEYDDPRGDLGLRKALQGHLSQTRGLSCSVGHLMIVNGSQQALDLCARLLVDAGAGVVVENPGYRMAHRVFEAIGARLLGVDVDEQGLKTDQLQKLSAAQVVYVTPTHQFPLGGLLPIARRRELLAWAAKHGTWVIEDDYDGEYRYTVRPEPTLLSLDTDERVIHIGTFSKTLSPTLRLGYMVLPTSLLDTFIAAKRLTDRHAATAAQRTLALLLDEGSFDRHVRRMRRQQHARQRALVDALEQQLQNRVEIQGAASGLHLVVWLKGVPVSEELAVATAALQRGVRVYPISPFYCSEAPLATSRRTAGLVVGYALLEPAAIREGVRRLAGALDAWAAQYKQAVSTIGL